MLRFIHRHREYTGLRLSIYLYIYARADAARSPRGMAFLSPRPAASDIRIYVSMSFQLKQRLTRQSLAPYLILFRFPCIPIAGREPRCVFDRG